MLCCPCCRCRHGCCCCCFEPTSRQRSRRRRLPTVRQPTRRAVQNDKSASHTANWVGLQLLLTARHRAQTARTPALSMFARRGRADHSLSPGGPRLCATRGGTNLQFCRRSHCRRFRWCCCCCRCPAVDIAVAVVVVGLVAVRMPSVVLLIGQIAVSPSQKDCAQEAGAGEGVFQCPHSSKNGRSSVEDGSCVGMAKGAMLSSSP